MNINAFSLYMPGQLYAPNFFPLQNQFFRMPPHVYNSNQIGLCNSITPQHLIPNNQINFNAGGMMLNSVYPYGHQMFVGSNKTIEQAAGTVIYSIKKIIK
jgi:hypothetical protein